jgi:ribosomal-protein-alanine N-acetyltransferase
MFDLQRLRVDHEAALLDFEVTNRAYFAESISDRGDDFFAEFADRHRALLAEQEAGVCAYHVLVDEHGKVVGRFNLYDLVDGTAVVGFRVAQQVAGRGVATATLRDLCQIARDEYGLRTLKAAAGNENVASQRVLAKAGFVHVGPAQVGGRPGAWYERALTRQ